MLPILLSNRANNTPPSPIRRLAHLAANAEQKGNEVYYLNIGQPDIKTPKEFFDGVNLFKDEVLAYENSFGNLSLRRAWVSNINRTLGLNVDENEMLITVGASEAIVFTFMTCCDPGDDVIIFDPTYANYMGFAAISGVRLVPVVSSFENNFSLPDISKIEKKLTNRTRIILLCNPNNPTGTLYSKEEIKILLELCNERNIFLVVDETYREMVYDDNKPLSVFHVDSNNKRVIVIDSLSKRFSLCGARLGCMITKNEEVLEKTLNQAQARLSCSTIEQFAASYMLENISDSYLSEAKKTYEERRNVLYNGLKEIRGVKVAKPDGAFYILLELPVKDTDDFCSYLLNDFSYHKKTLFAAPASGFYMKEKVGKNKIRLGFVLKKKYLKEATEVLQKSLETYSK